MITYTTGNIIEAKNQAIVCPVNCEGVMGAGLALEFKKYIPQYYKDYRYTCIAGMLHPGKMHVFKYGSINTEYIISFPTKNKWKHWASMDYINDGLVALKGTIEELGIESIALPKLGCGLGGLAWSNVNKEIQRQLGNLAINIVIYL